MENGSGEKFLSVSSLDSKHGQFLLLLDLFEDEVLYLLHYSGMESTFY